MLCGAQVAIKFIPFIEMLNVAYAADFTSELSNNCVTSCNASLRRMHYKSTYQISNKNLDMSLTLLLMHFYCSPLDKNTK